MLPFRQSQIDRITDEALEVVCVNEFRFINHIICSCRRCNEGGVHRPQQ